jgi:hypothetical protein
MPTIAERIDQLDVGLFDHIPSETTRNDRRSLLALHYVVKTFVRRFVYLEIGSHLGGSLQSFVVDPDCTQIISIDPRPLIQDDARGLSFAYPDNSTARMLSLLRQIPGADTNKIRPIEAGTDRISSSMVPAVDLCLIDGEHTDQAALRDARFCLSVIQQDGCLAFHDAHIVYRGLNTFINELKQTSRPFRAYALPDSLFVIEIGAWRFCDTPAIHAMLCDGYQSYLWSLMANDRYREILNRSIFRFLRQHGLIR